MCRRLFSPPYVGALLSSPRGNGGTERGSHLPRHWQIRDYDPGDPAPEPLVVRNLYEASQRAESAEDLSPSGLLGAAGSGGSASFLAPRSAHGRRPKCSPGGAGTPPAARAPLHRPLRELEVTTATWVRADRWRPGAPAPGVGSRPGVSALPGPLQSGGPARALFGEATRDVAGRGMTRVLSPAQLGQKAGGYCVPSQRLTLSASSPYEGGRRTPLYKQGG